MKLILSLIMLMLIGTAASDGDVGRVSIDLTTGKIIEYQSGIAPLGTLTQNAINAGHAPENVLERYINESEAQAYLNSLKPILITPKVKSNYIQAMQDINDTKNDMAIIRNQTNMTETQKTNNIRKLADYQYKSTDTLYNILKFLKAVFFS